MDNEFLMLCHKDTKKIGLCGNLVSEKLDGQRCFWDGGITAGMRVADIPWANKYDKRKQDFISNGLWSRLGNKVHAPDSWVQLLPKGVLLDGELWAGYEHRQKLMSAIKREDGSGDWSPVKYMVYDTPPAKRMFSERMVTYSGRKQKIENAIRFCADIDGVAYSAGFLQRYAWLQKNVANNSVIQVHDQWIIPNGIEQAKIYMDMLLAVVLKKGGEGLVVKGASSLYECARSHGSVKVKPFEDSEGEVVGFIAGEETTKGSRLLGMMGSLILKLANGKTLMLSGFTDDERTLSVPGGIWAQRNPGASSLNICFDRAPVLKFPFGTKVSFKYRGLTADGIPMEARFWRERTDE